MANRVAKHKSYQHTPEIAAAIDRAVDLHQEGHVSHAVSIYQHILSTNPHHPVPLHYLGLAAQQKGKTDQAIRLMKLAIASNPDYAQAYCNLANVYLSQGKPEDALEPCRRAVEIEPERANAHNLLGTALYALKQFKEAAQSYEAALGIEPELPLTYERLSDAYCQMKQLADAVKTYERAVSVYPDAPVYHNNLGSLYHLQHELERADACFLKSIALEPKYTLPYHNRVNILREQDRNLEAIACLQTILELKPDDTTAQHNLNALQGEVSSAAPEGYVENLFDNSANNFEGYLQDKLEYHTPELLKNILLDRGMGAGTYKTVVDLGCGTGLSGEAFKDISETLIGIDLSKSMIQIAQDKNIYDRLEQNDLLRGLNTVTDPVDLFIATDVFVYIGELKDTFEAIKQKAAKKTVFVFSTEHLDTAEGFTLRDTGRYAHSKSYIESLAKTFGFSLTHFEETNLRKEKTGWIIGGVYVLSL